MRNRSKIVMSLAGGALLASASSVSLQAADITITMAAPDWPPTRFMKEEFDKTYQSPDGHTTTLDMDFIPWPNFYERVAASLTSGEEKYQMIVTDSQWLGSFVEGGYYADLTQYMKDDPELTAIMKDLHPVLVSAYSTYPHKTRAQLEEAGEWPAPDTNYYGFPQFPDTYVTFYREDLFCHEGEAAAFQEKFGKTLPCTYEDWQDVDWDTFREVGEFFKRAKGEPLGDGTAEDDFYGIAYQAGKGYDFSTMQANAFVWQYGGSIWDETLAPDGQAEGVVNSDIAVEAMEHYLSLLPLIAASRADRSDGYLRDPGSVHAGQGWCDHRLGWPRRACPRSKHFRQSPTNRRSARLLASGRKTARSIVPEISAVSRSCSPHGMTMR